MANFQYIARDPGGKEVSGLMQAESEAAVLRTLGDRALFPVRVWAGAAEKQSFGAGRVRPREVGVFYSQMADLLRSGVPMLRTIDTLARSASRPAMREMVRQVRDHVSKGETLASSLGLFPKVFLPLHTAMIRAGEEAGFLEDVLTNLAGYIDRQDDLRSKVQGAMIYPVMLCVVGSLLLLGILTVLVPQFKPAFAHIDLPLPTKVLFAASDLLVHRFLLLLALTVLAGGAIWAGLRSNWGREFWGRWRMKVPILGAVNRSVSLTRFCRIFGTLLHNGVGIIRSLEISKDATGSLLLSHSIETAAQSVSAGETLADPLRDSGVFPAEIIEMIAVAEESNQLDKVLLQIAETVERRTNRVVDGAVRLVEPLILIVLAVTIGFVAVGLIYPIFVMSQTLQ